MFSRSGAGVGGRNLSVDAVREFRLLSTNYGAEYGRSLGGIIVIVTQSGTNTFHGSVFEFLRNSALDAKNFFDKATIPIPPSKRNQFGGSVGGPIVKDKTFLHAAFEGVRERLSPTALAFVPSLDARQGILPTGSVTVDQAVKPFLDLYPLPDGPAVGGGIAPYTLTPSQPSGENFWQVRIDHQLSANHSLFGRFTQDKANLSATAIATGTPSFSGLALLTID